MRYSFIILVMIFVMVLSTFAEDAEAKRYRKKNLTPDPKKYASLVVDADSGVILHQENADKTRYPASLTKMMTLYLTFEALRDKTIKLDQYVTVSRNAASQPRLNLNLKRGEKITVREAVYGLVVHSANDAAVVLAEVIAGSEKNFAKAMTRKAHLLGMSNTVFANASGLHNKKQVTTAKDLAKLLIALKRYFPQYYNMLSKTSFYRKGRRYRTHNQILMSYTGAEAGKTGYINASGFNLATQARRQNSRLVGVVMGGKTPKWRDKKMVKLLDKGFSKLKGTRSKVLKRFVSTVPVPKLKPWSTSVSATTGKGKKGWSVRMGGFKQEEQVVTEIASAMDIAPVLSNSQINFHSRRESHWARFLNLSEQEAKYVCRRLVSANKSCTVENEI